MIELTPEILEALGPEPEMTADHRLSDAGNIASITVESGKWLLEATPKDGESMDSGISFQFWDSELGAPVNPFGKSQECELPKGNAAHMVCRLHNYIYEQLSMAMGPEQ